jgi:hypothetical protein
MAKVMTSDDLIRSLKRRALIPTDQSTFSNEDFLEILNEEMDTGILPYLLEQHEEHLVTFTELSADLTPPFEYAVPYRAIGNKLRDIALIDGAGNPYELSRASLEEISDYSSFSTIDNNGVFYMEGNKVVFMNLNGTASDKIRMYFYLRPSTMVLEKEAGKITAIAAGGTETVITLDNFPEKYANNPLFDIVGSRSPNKLKKFDISAASVNRNTKSVTILNELLPDDLEVGDYLCQAEESPVPQIPTELHPILAQRGAVYCLESLGDTEGLGNAMRKLQSMEKGVTNLIENRVEGAPQKIKPRHTNLRDAIVGRYNNRNRGR